MRKKLKCAAAAYTHATLDPVGAYLALLHYPTCNSLWLLPKYSSSSLSYLP